MAAIERSCQERGLGRALLRDAVLKIDLASDMNRADVSIDIRGAVLVRKMQLAACS